MASATAGSQFVTPSPRVAGIPHQHTSTNSIRNSARQTTYSERNGDLQTFQVDYHRSRSTEGSVANNLNDSLRICYCDQPKCPPMCPIWAAVPPSHLQSDVSYFCPYHKTIQCQFTGCGRLFHYDCIRAYERNESRSLIDPFFCCLHAHQHTWDANTTIFPNLHERCRRLGIDCEGISDRVLTRKLSAVESCLIDCNVPNVIINEIKENPCLPYPSVVKMDEGAAKYQAEVGRRFEISLLMFKIKCCSCCGLTQPYHSNPFHPKESPLPKLHFNTKYYDAWECNCLEACRGQQFYGANRPVMISVFKSLHNNITPDVFICGIPGTSPNATLCHECYFEYNKRDGSDISEGE